MPLDYSKWDKLELSDDEDFECHPNVDKASMIRWKQAKIHSDRRDAKDTLTALRMELEVWPFITSLLSSGKPVEQIVKDILVVQKKLDDDIHAVRVKERDARWGAMQPIPMLYRPDVGKVLAEEGKEKAQQQIDERIKAIEREILRLEEEKKKKVTMDDIKEGFSKTIKSTGNSESAETKKTKTIEVIHTPKQAPEQLRKNPVAEDEEPLITDPHVDHFSFLTTFSDSHQFIIRHPHIVTTEFSDQILAQGFRCGMKDQTKRMKECIHQGLVLQYCNLLGKDGISLFFKRMETQHEKAREMFLKDVQDTINRITGRVVQIKQEEQQQKEEEEQQAMARYQAALQPDGSLQLPVLQEGDEERSRVFAQLPRTLQEGLLKGDVDLINTGIGEIEQGKANELLEACAKVGLIEMEESE